MRNRITSRLAAWAAASAMALGASVAGAQDAGPWVGVGYGTARLESPGPLYEAPTANMPALVVGFGTRRGPFVEGRVGRLRAEVTPAPVSGQEAPVIVGLRATLVEASIGYRYRTFALEPFRLRASAGAAWARVEDTWESDTPQERRRDAVPGAIAALGVEMTFGRRVALVTQATYRHFAESDDRPARHIGLRGGAWEVALHLRP